MPSPIISVIISVYDGEEYLDACLKSIERQTCRDYELIAVDDGSTDRTPEILETFKDRLNLQVIYNPRNIGLTRSLNKAISAAQGGYIARMDVDDISVPERLESQLVFMEKHPLVGVLGSSYYEIDEKGEKIGEVILPVEDAEIRKGLPKFNPFNHSSAMIRTRALEELGLYNENLVHSQDYELWYRILSRYQGYNLPEKLLLKRNPRGSITVARKRKQIYYSLMAWRMGRKYVERSPLDYFYYIKMGIPYLLPSFMIALLRSRFSRAKYTQRNQYYVIRLQP